jgi:hypothetical protein
MIIYIYIYIISNGIMKSFFMSRLSRAARLGQAKVRVFCLNESTTVAHGVGTHVLSCGLQAAFHFHVRASRALRPNLGNNSSDIWSCHAGTTFFIVKPIFGSVRAHFGNGTPDFITRCTDIHIVIAIRTTTILAI